MAFGSIIKSFASPSTVGQGLTFDGKYLWHTDQNTDLVYILDPRNGRIVKSFTAPDAQPSGMTFDGVSIWFSGRTAAVIFQMDPTNGRILKTIATTGIDCTGMTYDGKYLLLSDNTTDTIIVVDPVKSVISRSLPAIGGTFPRGLAWTGNRILHTNSNTNLIYLLDREGRVLKTAPTPATNTSGMAYDGNASFWVANFTNNLIYQLSMQ
jgi:DNA-binding beta-propeller fold protein YncE